MKRHVLILLTTAFLASCTTQKQVLPKSSTESVSSTKVFFDKITKNPSFDQVKISSRVDVQTGSFIPTLDATIYIEDGKKVWMNMIAVFLNVGRGVATPDGIKGYEKWNKTYIESDFSYLNKLLNVNFIDFQSLQNLLIGRTFIPVNANDFTLTQNSQEYILSSSRNLNFGTGKQAAQYSVLMKYDNALNLKQVLLKKVNSQDELEVNYMNWVEFNGMNLPKNVKINIKGDKTSQIFLENTKFEGSKMDTPYSVPNNYTKTEIK